jgi:Uma2 family endonuclease
MPPVKILPLEKKQAPGRASAGEEKGSAAAARGGPAAPTSSPEARITLHGIRWETYEGLLNDLADSAAPRLTYDRGTLEIMSPLQEHEELRRNIEALFDIIADVRGLDLRGLGSTTFRREDIERGLEPDACFYIQNAGRIRGIRQVDLSVDPPPDLVIEIDLTRSSIDKLSIYAQLGVPEVWRYTGRRMEVLLLQDGAYEEQQESTALADLDIAGLPALIEAAPSLPRRTWLRKARAWVRRRKG